MLHLINYITYLCKYWLLHSRLQCQAACTCKLAENTVGRGRPLGHSIRTRRWSGGCRNWLPLHTRPPSRFLGVAIEKFNFKFQMQHMTGKWGLWGYTQYSGVAYMCLLKTLMPTRQNVVNSGITRVGVTRGGNHQPVLPLFIFSYLKTYDLFLLITVTFIDFTLVSPHTFFTCPTSFVHCSL